MLINLDQKGLIRDVYYPYVGMEDHTTFGHYHRIGVYDEDRKKFSWLSEDEWKSSSSYLDETLVGKTQIEREDWGLKLTFVDFVHPLKNVICRFLYVKNEWNEDRKLRFFFNFDFHIYGVKANDTVYYEPQNNYVIFYKYNRYFLIDGASDHGGMDQYTTGKSEYRGMEGTWRDAEDGELSSHPIEQGSVDATIGFNLQVPANSQKQIKQWICLGKSQAEVEELNKEVHAESLEEFLDYTTNYWRSWVNKQPYDFSDIPKEARKLFKHSLLIIRTQIDNHGAILAANDTDIMKFNKDTYSYMWPRDASLIAMSLDNTGYNEITKRYYKFLAKVQTEEGFLMHKYNPDGSLGSSWHPWIYDGSSQIPIQEDETALPIIALYNYYENTHNIEFIQAMYDQFIYKAATFMEKFRDKETGLPLPSYDPWEEQKGTFTYTCSTVYAAFVAAAKLSKVVGHNEHAKRFENAAEETLAAIEKHLYCPKEKTFLKKIGMDGTKDYTADASISAIFLLGVLSPTDERVVNTMKRMKEKLTVPTIIGGLARYENDHYQRTEAYPDFIPGNPWIITTLWYTQWLIHVAKDVESEEFKEAEHWLKWVTKRAANTHVLPEQVHPFTGEHLSVAPLTWSHATYVDTILIYQKKLAALGAKERAFLEDEGEDF
jgi:oligosaccharide amylase